MLGDSVLSDVALVVVAAALFAFAIAAVMLVLKNRNGRATVTHGNTSVSFETAQTQLQQLHDKIEVISTEVQSVGKAVNNVPEGSPTLVQRVGTLEEKVDDLHKGHHWMIGALQVIGDQVGCKLVPPSNEEDHH